jgi:hypothetical protein
MASLVRPERF